MEDKEEKEHQLVFGPVPSRRLGSSLGINNIPPKNCTYSCIYCQVGATTSMDLHRREFFETERIVKEVEERLDSIREKGERVDYATFVPDGEPTLDRNLGRSVEGVSELNIDTAVISNGSLLWMEDVREELLNADLVSVKVDSVDPGLWRKVNRPNARLDLTRILDGIGRFADVFEGRLLTETMLVRDVNDGEGDLSQVAEFLSGIGPDTAYISIPTRPPMENWVESPRHEAVHNAYSIMKEKVGSVGMLTGPEGNSFQIYGELKDELGGITSVHPIRESSMNEILKKYGGSMELVEEMVEEGVMERKVLEGETFYTKSR
ncbi:MAG: radical SAM protein [Thermoplasmatota archaeon]